LRRSNYEDEDEDEDDEEEYDYDDDDDDDDYVKVARGRGGRGRGGGGRGGKGGRERMASTRSSGRVVRERKGGRGERGVSSSGRPQRNASKKRRRGGDDEDEDDDEEEEEEDEEGEEEEEEAYGSRATRVRGGGNCSSSSSSSSSSSNNNRNRKKGGSEVVEGEVDVKKAVQRVISIVSAADNFGLFQQPVTDDIAPSYSSIVTNPMDLSTAKKKLKGGQYSTVKQALDDMELMLSNCELYNGRHYAVKYIHMLIHTVYH